MPNIDCARHRCRPLAQRHQFTATMQQSNEGLCDTESDLSEEVESELESDEISDDIDDF